MMKYYLSRQADLSSPTQSGFTLIEAMLAISLCVLIGLVSVGGLNGLLESGRENMLRDKLLQILVRAQASSRVLNRRVMICSSPDLKTCGGEWRDGVLMFAGETVEGGQVLLAERFGVQGEVFMRFFPRYRKVIQFDPFAEASNDNGTFWYCRLHASRPAWAIKINRVGVTTVQTPGSDGEIRDAQGKPFGCHQQFGA